MGHSGAFRTVMQWVDHRLVEQIILLDAMYAGEHAFDEFIKQRQARRRAQADRRRCGTAQESEGFAKKYKFAVAREKMPELLGGFTKRERSAKLLYIRSQYEHMADRDERQGHPGAAAPHAAEGALAVATLRVAHRPT